MKTSNGGGGKPLFSKVLQSNRIKCSRTNYFNKNRTERLNFLYFQKVYSHFTPNFLPICEYTSQRVVISIKKFYLCYELPAQNVPMRVVSPKRKPS